MFVAEVLEAVMLVCFGLSWPMNAYKAYKGRTAKGTSWQFLTLICAGYVCGISAKLACGVVNWVLAVYVINLVLLAVNWAVYFRNRRLDREAQGMCADICADICADVCFCESSSEFSLAQMPAAAGVAAQKMV